LSPSKSFAEAKVVPETQVSLGAQPSRSTTLTHTAHATHLPVHHCCCVLVFLVASEAILECVNSLLASGEVPGLYTHEELEPLLAPLKEHMGDAGFQFRT
jgi:dynein heavy chain 2